MKLEVTDNNILFHFANDTVSGGFVNKTSWGFEVQDRTGDSKKPRWAKVIATGPKVKNVVKGDYVLIEALRWTNAIKFEDQKFWATNENEVMAVSKERPQE